MKGAEPPSLTAHKEMAHSYYDNYLDKDALRQALVAEQRGLCCYCMCFIQNDTTKIKIEHWQCQSRYPDRQLNYGNLLAACPGGEGGRRKDQHCDTRKADSDLQWNPADPAHNIEARLRYKMDGTIGSEDSGFEDQIKNILNLNLAIIKNNRKKALDALLDWLQLKPRPRQELERKLATQVKGDGPLEPYSQVAVWWLRRKLGEEQQRA